MERCLKAHQNLSSSNSSFLDLSRAEILADVYDPLGRLLVKAPCLINEHLKDLLLKRGVREVTIRDRGEPQENDVNLLTNEITNLEKRMSLIVGNPRGDELIAMVKEIILEQFPSQTNSSLPPHETEKS